MPYANITFTVQTNRSFLPNDFVQVSANASNYIIGRVVTYNPSTGALVITPLESVGSGTYSSWTAALTGPYGSSGTSGTSGAASSTGTSGTAGSSGLSRTSGTSGLSGSSGSSGVSGASGLSRSSGTSGAAGANGPTGATGPQGGQGPTGNRGPSGTSGSSGATGPQGPTGGQGPTGPRGPQGPTGAQGAAGGTGPQGPANSNNQTLNQGSPFTFNTCVWNQLYYAGQVYAYSGQGARSSPSEVQFITGPGYWQSPQGAIGAGGFFPTSSRDVKTNIQPYTASGLDIVNATEIVRFKFDIDGLEDDAKVGFIAEDAPIELTGPDRDKMIIPTTAGIIMKALQELDTKLKVLEGKI